MNLPADLSPETAAWLRMQMTIAAARAVEPLRAEIDKVDDWANGVYAVLLDVLPWLLKAHPALAREIEPEWRAAAESFDLIDLHGQSAKPDEPLEFLEARKMLYRLFAGLKLWPGLKREGNVREVPRVRRA